MVYSKYLDFYELSDIDVYVSSSYRNTMNHKPVFYQML